VNIYLINAAGRSTSDVMIQCGIALEPQLVAITACGRNGSGVLAFDDSRRKIPKFLLREEAAEFSFFSVEQICKPVFVIVQPSRDDVRIAS
jgi:hypothetical protein